MMQPLHSPRFVERLIAFAAPPVELDRTQTGLGSGIGWGAVAFLIMALAGLSMNLAIAALYGAAALGNFNIVLTIYILSGQISAFGHQYSTLYYVSTLREGSDELAVSVLSAIITVFFLSSVMCAAIIVGTFSLVEGDELSSSIYFSGIGILLYPLNKILLSSLNGRRRMRLFAGFTAGRVVLIVWCIRIFWGFGVSGVKLSAALSISELTTFLGLVLSHHRILGPTMRPAQFAVWARRHIAFGSKCVLGGILTELNTRIDILLLGIFASSVAVGVYSVASVFAEGILQILIVIRNNIDPVIARLTARGEGQELRSLIQWTKRIGYFGAAFVMPLAVLGYPLAIVLLFGWDEFGGSWPIFTILMCGIAGAAGYIPLYGMFQQSNLPLEQSAFLAAVAALNLCATLPLVAAFGGLGAAIGAAVAQLGAPLILRGIGRGRLPELP